MTNSIRPASRAGDVGEPIDIGSRLELFVDEALIDELSSTTRRLHRPRMRECVLTHDQPWEGEKCGYYTIFEDDGRFRLYYFARTLEDGDPGMTVRCYAESEDGVDWEKPSLGLIEYEGSRANNIVWGGEGASNMTPFKDPNAGPDSEARYKAVGSGEEGLLGFESPDGLDWSLMETNPLFTRDQGAYDSQNLAFWDPVAEEYRAYFRYFEDDRRGIKTATSDDFVTWTDPEPLNYPNSPPEQLYTNVVAPYYRAPHLLIGFPMRYVERDWESDSMRQLPGWEKRQERWQHHERYGAAMTDSLFMSSRDGETFDRWPRAFLRPGLWERQTATNWVYGDNEIAWHLIETESREPGKPRELSLYATERYWLENNRLRRFTMRVDGFVSIAAPLDGGEVTTKVLRFEGDHLQLNFATSAAGSIQIEFQSPDGNPYPGFELAESPELFGDHLKHVVTWPNEHHLGELSGKPVRMRFVLRDADLYSMRFRNIQ